MTMSKQVIGIIGLGVIGQSLAMNIERNGFSMAGYDLDEKRVEAQQDAWRDVVAQSVILGISVPAFSSALAYYDGYRQERLPVNLLQAQRNYFGAHTYERVDKPRGEFFHSQWI